jgi:predicted RecA/RadA family phage recombinase
MNIITSIAPIAASAATLAASPTLLLALGLLHLGAKVVGRLIPDTRKGVLGGIRKAAKVLAAEPTNRVSDVLVNDVLHSIGVIGAASPQATSFKIQDGVVTLPKVETDAVHVGNAPEDTATQLVADLTTNAKNVSMARAAVDKLGSLLGKLKS